MIYADVSSLPVFFGNEGGVLSGRWEERNLLSNHSPKYGVVGNRTFSAKKNVFQLILEINVCLIRNLSRLYNSCNK